MEPTYKITYVKAYDKVKIDSSMLKGPFPDLTAIDWAMLEEDAKRRLDNFVETCFLLGYEPPCFYGGQGGIRTPDVST